MRALNEPIARMANQEDRWIWISGHPGNFADRL